MQLAGNENDSEISNGATCRCDRRSATRGLWVCGPIVGSWVRCSWVVGLLFVGSPFVGRGFAIRGFVRLVVRGFDDLVGGATISTFLGLRSLSLCVFAHVSPFSLSFSLCATPKMI